MRALVTGGGGFLGRAIVRALLARGDSVLSFSRGAYPELERLGAESVRGDLVDADAVRRAAHGVDCIFHVAAKAGIWGSRAEYWEANVTGTLNVIAACRAEGVGRLVHTSSPSVCFDGRDHVRASNDLPLAESFLAHYPASKAEAERAALAANSGSLAVCALRPHLIFGPGDPHILPRLVARARAGKLAIIGDGKNVVSLTYVDNAAAAHVAAAESLVPGAACAGRAYFIAQEKPVVLWDWVATLLERVGAPPVRRRLSLRKARLAGAACEALWRALPLPGEPPMTRFVAQQLATSHSYDMRPAREDLGYEELVGLEEATERAIADFTRTAPSMLTGPS